MTYTYLETWEVGVGGGGGGTRCLPFANARSYARVSGIQNVFESRGFMFLFGFWNFLCTVALFNGLTISDIRIMVLHVYC